MNPEGEVIEILEHSDKKYVGVLELSDSFAFVKVDSRKFPTDVFIPLRDLKGSKRRSKSAGTGHRMARHDEKSRG